MQKILSAEQIEAFYHDEFVVEQARDFASLIGSVGSERRVTDMGGGCGFFAKRLMAQANYRVRVVDMDVASIDACHASGVEATLGDALTPINQGDEDVVSFNMMLHHLVASSERATRTLQSDALAVWKPHVRAVFVNEYIYESYFGNVSGWLIFKITKNPILSQIGRIVSTVVPSLKANTFGVGVRFRASDEWIRLFDSAGYVLKSKTVGESEPVSFARRLLFIKQVRRDSYLLEPKAPA